MDLLPLNVPDPLALFPLTSFGLERLSLVKMSGNADRGSMLRTLHILAARPILGSLPPGSPGPELGSLKILLMAGGSTPHSLANSVTVRCEFSIALMIGVRSTVDLSTVRVNSTSSVSLLPFFSSSSLSSSSAASFNVLLTPTNAFNKFLVNTSYCSSACSKTSWLLVVCAVGTSIVCPEFVIHTMYSPEGMDRILEPNELTFSRVPSMMYAFNSSDELKLVLWVDNDSNLSKSSMILSSLTAFDIF